MVKRFIKKIIILLRPIIRAVAELCDVRLNYHCVAQGQYKLIIQDFENAKKNNIPKSVYFNTRSGMIKIGKNTVFGEDVMLLTGKHLSIFEAEKYDMPLHYVPETGRDILIGNNCYIGSGAIIIGKVSIGDYAVIGAGSVVIQDVPARTFVAGLPAKIIKKLS